MEDVLSILGGSRRVDLGEEVGPSMLILGTFSFFSWQIRS